MARMRSPNYPSIPLRQAIQLAGKIHSKNRTNVIDRDSAVRDMGYSGITGRSLKVLAALIQFGLLSKAGKGSVKVTQTTVDILHGIDPRDRNAALLKAGTEPSLFKMVFERFPDGVPSENAIRSYLIQQGFADVAIGPAINSFMETYHELENIRESESHGDAAEDVPESPQSVAETFEDAMNQAGQAAHTYVGRTPPISPETLAAAQRAAARELLPNEVYLDIRGSREVHVEGILDYTGILDLEEKLKALKMILKKPETTTDTAGAGAEKKGDPA